MKVLSCHPGIRCVREPFNPNLWGDTYLGRVHDLASLDSAVAAIWHDYNGIKHVWDWSGFPFAVQRLAPVSDLTTGKLEEDMTLNLRMTAQQHTRVIFLTRRNQLQRLISYEIGKQTQVWHREGTTKAGIDATALKLNPLDPAYLRLRIGQGQAATELVRSALRANRTPSWELSYEDIFAPGPALPDGLSRVNQTLAFLGAEPLPEGAALGWAKRLLNPAVNKVNSELTYRMVPNIEEVEAICGNDETGHVFDGLVPERGTGV